MNKLKLLSEDKESKNRSPARKYIRHFFEQKGLQFPLTLENGHVLKNEWEVEDEIRKTIPNSKTKHSKFTLGVVRIYLDLKFNANTDQNELNRKFNTLNTIIQEINTSHYDEYTRNLARVSDGENAKGLSFDQLNDIFNKVIHTNRNKDKEKNSILAKSLTKNERYTFVKCDTFEKASQFSEYTSWCITHSSSLYDRYTEDSMCVFYFALRDDYKTCEETRGENTPLDDYGLSMIAINVNPDGTLKNCTCRWNHENGGNDNIMTTEQLTKLFGQNFYDIFKPRSIDEQLKNYEKYRVEDDDICKKNGWIKIEKDDELSYVKPNVEEGYIEHIPIVGVSNQGCIIIENDHFVYFTQNGEQIDRFDQWDGDFDCYNCDILTSLEGAPQVVSGSFVCSECKNLTSLEGAPQKVGGYFSCFNCKNLPSLKGAPQVVGGDFDCGGCTNLTSLEGAPQKVGGKFNCSRCNNLTSLEGAPQKVGRDFWCSGCDNLTSLKGTPQEVGGGFFCSYCDKLTSLVGAPQEVGGNFKCNSCNNLISLKGTPQEVGGEFDCHYCTNLTSLEGAPQEVGRDFNCSDCRNLTSLEGAPQKVGGGFDCSDCRNLTSLEGVPQEVGGGFYCYYCSNLTSLEGAPQEVGRDFSCFSCTNLTSLEGLNVSGIKGSITVPPKLKSQLDELKQIQKIQECYNFYFD